MTAHSSPPVGVVPGWTDSLDKNEHRAGYAVMVEKYGHFSIPVAIVPLSLDANGQRVVGESFVREVVARIDADESAPAVSTFAIRAVLQAALGTGGGDK